ncbi:MAG TPA: redoxin family protein [Thermoanaerobaculia bacterium]|nr:redoxin family protein [Thermoanaerobaculia bacterium]
MTSRFSSRVRLGAVALTLALLSLVAFRGTVRAEGIDLSCHGGGRLTDADLGRGVNIVVVWASWSPRCHGIAGRVGSLAARWGSRARVVTVNFQEDGAAVERFAGKGLGAPVCLDPDGIFSHNYKIATLPGLVVLKDGQVVYAGKLPDDPDSVIAPAVR